MVCTIRVNRRLKNEISHFEPITSSLCAFVPSCLRGWQLIMQNKANVKMGSINISTARTKAYANEQRTMSNERYSKQTQSNPIPPPPNPHFSPKNHCLSRLCTPFKRPPPTCFFAPSRAYLLSEDYILAGIARLENVRLRSIQIHPNAIPRSDWSMRTHLNNESQPGRAL